MAQNYKLPFVKFVRAIVKKSASDILSISLIRLSSDLIKVGALYLSFDYAFLNSLDAPLFDISYILILPSSTDKKKWITKPSSLGFTHLIISKSKTVSHDTFSQFKVGSSYWDNFWLVCWDIWLWVTRQYWYSPVLTVFPRTRMYLVF